MAKLLPVALCSRLLLDDEPTLLAALKASFSLSPWMQDDLCGFLRGGAFESRVDLAHRKEKADELVDEEWVLDYLHYCREVVQIIVPGTD